MGHVVSGRTDSCSMHAVQLNTAPAAIRLQHAEDRARHATTRQQ